MGRTIEGYTQGQAREYVPRANGNRQSVDPLVVTIIQPTHGDRRYLDVAIAQEPRVREGLAKLREGLAADTSPDPLAARMLVREGTKDALIRRYVREIQTASGEPYIVAGMPITDAASFIDHGEPELVSEVAAEISDSVSLSEAKKKP